MSSYIYFYVYSHGKILMKNLYYSNEENQSNHKDNIAFTVFSSFFSATIAELLALSFYYPFDLIKTRMQTSNHTFKYNGTFDAFHKVFHENKSQLEIKNWFR
jgi:hypothetical protein